MQLEPKEMTAIKDLQTQEKSCIEKYRKYAQEAKDPELKTLFGRLEQMEQKHYDSLGKVLQGQVPESDCNDSHGEQYQPKTTYSASENSEDKQRDAFLATDGISTEKLVSSEYNTNVFVFADACIRKLLADIQIEEQNHAEMLFKYKQANGMA